MNQIKKLNEMIEELESEGYETRFYVGIPEAMGFGDGWEVLRLSKWFRANPHYSFQEMRLYRRKKPVEKPVEDVVGLDINDMLEEVAKRENCDPDEIEWYSWPQTFATSAGPCGVGGNVCSRFQVYAFDPPSGRRQMECCGKWRHWNGEFMQGWS